MTQSLPSHSQFLTSLVASLSRSPPQSPPRADAFGPTAPPPGPADAGDRRHLLLTLHVLFPGVVLPALDLLDRRLVTRITVAGDKAAPGEPGKTHARGHDHGESGDGDEGARIDHPTTAQRAGDDEAILTRVYTLRSLASTLTRRSGRDAASTSKTYIVYLDAWSCSCAGFALDAFARHPHPAIQADVAASSSPGAPDNDPAPGLSAFGGMGAHGFLSHDGDVPCCKHLLACLLTETCGGMLGSRVDERRVTREELAGIISNV